MFIDITQQSFVGYHYKNAIYLRIKIRIDGA